MFKKIKDGLSYYDLPIFLLGLTIAGLGLLNSLLALKNHELPSLLLSAGVAFVGIGIAHVGATLAAEAEKAAYTKNK